MNLLAIDPGVTCCGWAIFRETRLWRCGLSRTKETTIEGRIRAHVEAFKVHGIDMIVVEKPEVYQQRFWKGDPRDLIELAMVVGGIVGDTGSGIVRGVRVAFPKDWKGQIKKEVSEKRTYEKLSPEEKRAVEQPEPIGEPASVPSSLIHNMYDAIGIGLWALGR